jgi:hypothetical protein
MDKDLYKPFKSSAKNKKYSVYVKDNDKNKKLIHFGDKRYEHFKDKIGEYKKLDHGDKERRENYLKRAKGIKDKTGKLTYKDKNSANFWSVNFLW